LRISTPQSTKDSFVEKIDRLRFPSNSRRKVHLFIELVQIRFLALFWLLQLIFSLSPVSMHRMSQPSAAAAQQSASAAAASPHAKHAKVSSEQNCIIINARLTHFHILFLLFLERRPCLPPRTDRDEKDGDGYVRAGPPYWKT
jgi:hypothetical protein